MKRNQQKDSFEAPLGDAYRLMRSGRGEEACRLLASARDRAILEEDSGEASLFTSVRGSYLAALGQHHNALDAYLEAERLSGGGENEGLAVARHLIYGMHEPADALTRVDQMIARGLASAPADLECLALKGICHLFLGEANDSISTLKIMISKLRFLETPSLSCDLTLVEELSRKHVAAKECLVYLDLVESKAREEGNARSLARVLELKALL